MPQLWAALGIALPNPIHPVTAQSIVWGGQTQEEVNSSDRRTSSILLTELLVTEQLKHIVCYETTQMIHTIHFLFTYVTTILHIYSLQEFPRG